MEKKRTFDEPAYYTGVRGHGVFLTNNIDTAETFARDAARLSKDVSEGVILHVEIPPNIKLRADSLADASGYQGSSFLKSGNISASWIRGYVLIKWDRGNVRIGKFQETKRTQLDGTFYIPIWFVREITS